MFSPIPPFANSAKIERERVNMTSLVNFFPVYTEKTLRPLFSTNFKNINSLTREVVEFYKPLVNCLAVKLTQVES